MIRVAGPSDLGAVSDLESSCLGQDAWSPALIAEGIAGALPTVSYLVATDDEVLRLVEIETLAGTGIGYIDAHLLAATRLTGGARLWTRDRRLAEVSNRLSVGLS